MSQNVITLDFDGVIHAYTTPWEAADKIPDPAVPGAIEWILKALEEGYDVAIFSARSSQDGGIPAMKNWLKKEAIKWLTGGKNIKDIIYRNQLANFKPVDNSSNEVFIWGDELVNRIIWPTTKLPSKVYIDDNAHRFEGRWPSFDDLSKMESWVKE